MVDPKDPNDWQKSENLKICASFAPFFSSDFQIFRFSDPNDTNGNRLGSVLFANGSGGEYLCRFLISDFQILISAYLLTTYYLLIFFFLRVKIEKNPS